MALDFPSSPALNDTYTDSGKTWQWNGSGWQLIVTGTVTNADISATAEIAVSKLADGAARQLLQTDAAGTGVEWTSNVDIPGTLDVTGAAVFDSTVAVTGALTKSGSNVVTVGDTGTVTSTMIANSTIVDADISTTAEIAVSKLADGAARQLLQTDAAGTGVEWTSNVDLPGTLDVTGATTLDSTLSFPLGSAGSPSIYPGTDTNTGFWSPAADTLAVSTGGGEGFRITSDKYLRMATSTGGIQFNGDTAAANALDDYEEGTWTPTGGTWSDKGGTYTKIGRTVIANGWANASGGQTLTLNEIGGLPFAYASYSSGTGSYIAFEGQGDPPTGATYLAQGSTMNIGTTSMKLYPTFSRTNAGVAGGDHIQFTVVYRV